MRTKRVLRAAVAFLFAFGVLAADLTPLRLPPQTASAVTQADIDKLKKESNALSSKKSEVNKQLSALKKDKANTLKRKALLDSLEIGVEVVTIGGIYGKITALDEKTATLEVAPGTKITFARAAINGKVTKEAEQ